MSFVTPQFFAWDGLQSYSDGEISSLGNEYSWTLPGTFSLPSWIVGEDNFDEYDDGDLDAPDLGRFWTEDGSTNLVP